jgi:opacity protein-like surface antigen
MSIRALFGVAAAAVAIPVTSLAQSESPFSYTVAEFSYIVDIEVDPSSIDGDGFSLGGTFTVADSFFVGGSYEDYDFDRGISGEMLEIGGGYFHNLNPDLDFVATLHFVDVEFSPGNASDDGLALGGGIRAALSDDIEVDAMLKFVDMDAGDSDTSVELRGRYYFSDEFAVQLQIDLGGDFETIGVGVRAEF